MLRPLKPYGEGVIKIRPRRGKGAMAGTKNVAGEKMPGQAQGGHEIRRRGFGIRDKKSGQGQQPLNPLPGPVRGET